MELARPTVATHLCGILCWGPDGCVKVNTISPEAVFHAKLEEASDVTCNHLWMREEWFVVYGTVLTGAEATELPWRRRKDHELASPNEIRRDLELVQSLYIRGQNQGPEAFDEVKLYLREDIR